MKTKPQIFVSYSWKDKDIVDQIDKDFQTVGITLIRDVRDLKYKDSIKQYMKRIRESDFVLMIISNNFLESHNCMFEVLEFVKDESYKNRILPIVLPEINLTPEGISFYTNYWQNRVDKLENINATVGEFLTTISDMLCISLEELKNNNYRDILDKVGFDNLIIEKVDISTNESSEVFKNLSYYTKLKEEIDIDLELAAEFQNSLLPSKDMISKLPGVRCDYIFLPFLKVAGDFIDVQILEEGMYGFSIADSSGRGISSALRVIMFKTFFNLYGKDLISPELLFEILNDELYSYMNSGEILSCFYGIYFVEEKKIVYSNGNHPPPFLLRARNGKSIPLLTEGFFLGVFRDTKFEEKEVSLEKGDRILYYTKGVTEATNPKGEKFGEHRLLEIYKAGKDISISELIYNIKDAVFNFTGDNLRDDITIGIIEIE